ncbi:uncharacterized protein BDW70DRAFT_126866 [Aspergillus foveolatus]|uniref:uncharacterized protein n=1 Tax=Aspergillus foveolatus TaxID=210207 RepID=UPI003CCC9BBB
MTSTRSAASRKRNSTTNALDILNSLNKRAKAIDDRKTQSARPVRQLRNIPRTPRRDIFDIPGSESPEHSRRATIRSLPIAAARPLNYRDNPVLEDIWTGYSPSSFSEHPQSPNTGPSRSTAEPALRRRSTRLRSVRKQPEIPSTPHRASKDVKRREADHEDEEVMEEYSWQLSHKATDNESASETGDRNSLAGEENDLYPVDLFPDDDRSLSPSAQQLDQTLEQSGQFGSAQSTPNKGKTPQRASISDTRSQRVVQSSSKSYRPTPRAAVPSPSVVVHNSPNRIHGTPLPRRSTRSRPSALETQDDDGDGVIDENAATSIARDGDVGMCEDEHSAKDRRDDDTKSDHETAELSNLNVSSDSIVFGQDSSTHASLPATQSGEPSHPSTSHELRLGASVTPPPSVSRESSEASEASGPAERQLSPQDAPSRRRLSGRLNTVSAANAVLVAQESSASRPRFPDAPNRRKSTGDTRMARPGQPSPERPTSKSSIEESTRALASRRIRRRRSRIVFNYKAHQTPEPESSYPQCKEAMELGKQQRNWKVLILEAHKMGKRLNPTSTERFKDIIDLIEYLHQWYESIHQHPRPAQSLWSKDSCKHEEILGCILSEGNLLLDHVYDTIIKRGNRERGRRLFERIEACVIPKIIELVFTIFDAYHSHPKRLPNIYHHLHRAITLLRDLCERMTILTKEGYVQTSTRTENLLRPLQKLIKASESGLLQNGETDSLDQDVDVIESTDEDTPTVLSRRPWTDTEGIALMDGLIKHQGPGRYALIMRDFADRLKGRTLSELRDKARQAYTLYKPRIQEELRTREGREKWQWLVSVQE